MKFQAEVITLVLGLSSGLLATKTPFNATFDTLPAIPDESRLSPVGIYQGLSYQGINVNQPGLLNETFNGVMPESFPNQAAVLSDPGNITSVYPGSKTKSFTVNSFYYGCGLKLQQAALEPAAACSVTVTGYAAGSGKVVATQEFRFTPAEVVDLMNPPTLGTLNSKFTGLEKVSFKYAPSATVLLLLDNIIGSTTS
ncbi:hypothetical protein ACLMJK_006567 [Lecanora helva]